MCARLVHSSAAISQVRDRATVSADMEIQLDQLSRFFEVSADLFCIAGFDGYFKVLNSAWEAVLGLPREDLLRSPCLEFVHPDDRDSTIDKVHNMATGNHRVSFVNRYRCQNGSYKWLLWNATAIADQELIYAVAHDITDGKLAVTGLQQARHELEMRVQERTAELARSNAILLAEVTHCRQMERSLWEAQEKYRSIFENAVEGIFQSTPDGFYLNVNPALARIKGYDSPKELVTAVDDIGQQSYVDPSRRIEFKSLMETHGVVNGFEYQAYRKDGTKIWLSMNARAVRSSEGSVLYYEGTIEDITGRKQLEDQLRLVQKMEAVGQLAGGIAHDFNNLLGVIMGYGELLLEKLDDNSPLRNNAEQINQASRSAASLVGQLLAFSRQQVLQPVVLNLNRVVTNVEKMLGSVIGENIALTTTLDPTLGRIKADQGQMEQIIVNLVVNARDAMPHGGELTIKTANVGAEDTRSCPYAGASEGPGVMLTVADTGIGMDQETQSHIFEPFFTTKGRGKGTGLGLASVYGAVKQSGGSIWVHSELGQGTAFNVLLPCVEEPEQETRSVHSPESSWEGSETVLLVEDDASLRELILNQLAKHGYSVLEASNGLQALSLARRFRGAIHLVLSDVVMPGMSGPQMVGELISIQPSMRVLYMSGYTEFPASDNQLRGHGKSLLPKPFSQKDLLRKVREAIET
jgi:PAS domain S-box-containing protein